ncbi:MAG: PAS domain S-box protein, partial [Chitinophagaceae bacterium]
SIVAIGIDVSRRVIARQQLEQSEAFLEVLSNSVPAMIFYLDEHQRYKKINDTFVEWYGVPKERLIGKTPREFLGEESYLKIKRYLDAAYAGKQVHYETVPPPIMKPGRHLSIVYTPHKNDEGKVIGVIVHGTDITATVESQLAIRDSEAKIRGILDNARAAIAIFVGKDMIIENPNQVFIELLGKGWGIVGKPLREALPELDEDNAPLLQILDDVYTTGKPYRTTSTRVNLVRDGVMTNGFYNFSYTPVFDDNGKVLHIVVAAVEVTEQLLAQQELKERTREFELAMQIALLGSFRIDLNTSNTTYTENIREWFQMGATSASLSEILKKIHEDDRRVVEDAINDSVAGKNNGQHDVTYRLHENNGSDLRYYRSVGKVTFEGARPTSILGMIQDVTAQVRSAEQSQALQDLLNNAIEGSAIGVFRFRLKDGAAEYSPAYSKIMTGTEYGPGKTRDFFEQYMHPDDHVLRKPIAAELKNTNVFHFEPRVIWEDGSSHRIVATGSILADQNGQPITVVGTVRDITEEQKERLAAKEELERSVQQRTHELATAVEALKATNEQLEESNQQLHHSNDELAQYAFVASHDLQEPLRKIQVFTGLVSSSKELPASVKKHVDKIHSASVRMSMLIQDLLT